VRVVWRIKEIATFTIEMLSLADCQIKANQTIKSKPDWMKARLPMFATALKHTKKKKCFPKTQTLSSSSN
jgi:cell fate (sporulation/competence/biofilm development) regulator YmcA (YheA/YmcA/DUF963 family)